MLAIGLSLALGYAGQVNLAQAAFFGMGAYTTAVLTLHTGLGYWGAFPLSILPAHCSGSSSRSHRCGSSRTTSAS